MKKPTERFTQTADYYVKYRPSYPAQMGDEIIFNCHLNQNSIIADVGSGTGLLTELWLRRGNRVYGVEPNESMRNQGEQYLAIYPKFVSVNGTAESTTLSSSSIDLVSVGTAFHWFEVEKTREEFRRILKPQGWVVLVWNVRDLRSELVKEYEALVQQYGINYRGSVAENMESVVKEDFFSPNTMKTIQYPFGQRFDWEGFQGRLRSTSYCPTEETRNYPAMMVQLRKIFDSYQYDGFVDLPYETKVYYGHL